MDPLTYGIFFVVLTILSTVLVSYAYRKMKISLKHKSVMHVWCNLPLTCEYILCFFSPCHFVHRIALKRGSAVSKEVLAELSQSNGKKLSKAEKDER